jgi:hypothetical protein
MRNFAAFVSLSSQATLFTRQRKQVSNDLSRSPVLVTGLLA